MSSPFSLKFHSIGKDPLKMLGDIDKDGVMSSYEQKRQDAIEANTPATMKGSPAHSHDPKKLKDLEDRLKKVKSGEEGTEGVTGQGGADYELIAKIQGQIKEAKSDHSEKKKLK